MMTALQAIWDVASALRIAASRTALGKEQRYSQLYEPSSRWYLANVSVNHDQQVDADEEGDDGDGNGDYKERTSKSSTHEPLETSEVLSRRWRGGFVSRLGRRRFAPGQRYAYQQGGPQQVAAPRPHVQGPPPRAPGIPSSTATSIDKKQQIPRGSPDNSC